MALGRSLALVFGDSYQSEMRSVRGKKERWVTLREDSARRSLTGYGLRLNSGEAAPKLPGTRDEDIPF